MVRYSIYTMEFYTAVKNEVIKLAYTCMNTETIKLSEIVRR